MFAIVFKCFSAVFVSVSDGCFKCFICLLLYVVRLHLNVSKVGRGDAHEICVGSERGRKWSPHVVWWRG